METSTRGGRSPDCPLVYLDGVIELPGERQPDSLIFVLRADSGRVVQVTYGALMSALRFAQVRGIIPALSDSWWASVEQYQPSLG